MSRQFEFYSISRHVRSTFKDNNQNHSLLITGVCTNTIPRTTRLCSNAIPIIIVIDYISKRSAVDFYYDTHQEKNQSNSGKAVRNTSRMSDYKVKDLITDDITDGHQNFSYCLAMRTSAVSA